jgi:hypothetical protein
MDKLQEALKEKMEKEHQQAEVSPAKSSIPEEPKGKLEPNEGQQLENVQNQIKRLRAEQELKAVQDGYKSYQDAVIQLSKTREQLEADRAKLPNILEREKILQDKESDIDQRVTLAEQYSAEKHTEGNDYFVSRRKEGDAHYKTAMDNFVREYNEKNEILKRMTEELQEKIDICNENAEPIGLLMAKDSRLIYNYLTNFIFPILDNGTLKLFGVFNGKLELIRQQAKLLHDSLYTDALRLLKTAEEIKEK